uniref:Protein aurora borealis n=1 Tax=Laticauda laticaudata TaxID=8630 RepID=A0A8C5SIC7_LATLA
VAWFSKSPLNLFLQSPGRFMWSIDELALIDPVEINSEDIHRQAFYLSQTRIDREVEERKQRAIEEFFTKSTIVPSPWTNPIGKQDSQLNSTRCKSQLLSWRQEGSLAVACQTVLSLPMDFDLEKILGDYFKADESADQSQESLSSSSLRRKLFLDENGSLSSENFSPSPSLRNGPASLGVLCSIDLSPVRCRSPLNSSSSGHLSSSPIQGNARAYSLGSLPSPSLTHRNPANLASPSFSPVGIQLRKTPLADQRQFTFRSPDLPSVSNVCRQASASSRSPYMEYSPLRSHSPMRLLSCRGAALYQSSFLRLPCTPENFQEELAEAAEAILSGSPRAGLTPIDVPSAGSHLEIAAESLSPETPEGVALRPCLESPGEKRTVEITDPEMLEENSVKGSSECDRGAVTGLSLEGSCICMAPLAESSVSPCESSSLQVRVSPALKELWPQTPPTPFQTKQRS